MTLTLFICTAFFFFLSILYLKFRSYVPILMYHRIADIPGDRNALPPNKFRDQLDYLVLNGFHTITPDDLLNYYQKNVPLPKKPILLTFDDGYTDNYTTALPLLKERNMSAVVCPILNWIGKPNHWENFSKPPATTMTLQELQDWHTSGCFIAAHTCNHPFLSNCDKPTLTNEILTCKQKLSEEFVQEISFLCYPYGDFNEQTITAVKSCGYKGAFAIFENVPIWKLNMFCLPRIPIQAHQSMWEFRLKVSNIHILFIALRKWERIFKKFFRHKK